ncbi:ferric reductase-like transmembrane domain-containing protein [Cognatiyoonia sp. IB215446]|uniref:ferredoxin reductase family protein n=1 Tax=Cognatiyoonia sp. IB215446 TaxID=3097355 RepID=UPI002A12D4DF|nr:ferric reductase-like transmembrane domain-containing protein [Cognatiyoonia sp. IB215446]MDX8348655.1 ferric reductase-like transmembrane domain-containing protein [Cognatiyoonia sp. IB215446]
MQKSTLILAAIFALFHLAFVAPFVPVANILPAGLGALSMSSMAMSLILAARWRLIDRLMGGPDKSYAAHRWLGFFALAGALGHWALASSVGSGLLPLLAESGENSGTIAALGLLVMTAAAMVRAIPYHVWKLSHMLMGPIFLFAAYHTFFVASPLAVGAAPWALMAVVSVIGLIAWGQTLLRKRTPTKLVSVSEVTPFEGGVDITLASDTPLSSYRPGQFATLAHNRARAEAHPFTIAGGDEWSRRFVIRAAGDWTNSFVQNVTRGDAFRLSGGFGRFLPQIHAGRTEQLWVAGGVGITPFLAALEKMQPDGNARITLLYCIRSRASAGAIATVEKHAARLPQLALTVVNEAHGDLLIATRLAYVVREMSSDAEAYLCGPEGLKLLVETAWDTQGKTGAIHSERFDFRGAYSLADLIYIGKPVVETARTWARTKVNAVNAPLGS